MRKLHFLLLLSLLVVGCNSVSFSHPLGENSTVVKDLKFYGTWLYVEKEKYEEVLYVHIGFDDELNQTRIVVSGVDAKGEVGIRQLVGHINQIEGKSYLSLRGLAEQEPKSYTIFWYQVKGDETLVWYMDDKPFHIAFGADELKADVKISQFGSDIHVTDSQERARKFILENHDEIFTESIKLKRLNAKQGVATD